MHDGQHLTAGVDVGTSAVKVVVARSRAGENGEVLGTSVQRIRRRSVVQVVKASFDEAADRARVRTKDLDYVASTGDGEAVEFRTGHFYSMTTHARGALHLVPEARAVLDIGALHARAIRIDEHARVVAHRMTSQCASGTGQFLEDIARYLGVPIEDVGALSRSATSPEKVSSICAVLAETDVINMVSRGITTPDILKGIHMSIAGRLVMLLRAAGAQGVAALTGGLAADDGLVAAIEEALLATHPGALVAAPLTVRAASNAILAGATGAALLGARRHDQLAQRGAPVLDRIEQADATGSGFATTPA